jgi:hypothetical protein
LTRSEEKNPVLESNQALDVGQIIADRYRIVRPIGRGGMSIVVEICSSAGASH